MHRFPLLFTLALLLCCAGTACDDDKSTKNDTETSDQSELPADTEETTDSDDLADAVDATDLLEVDQHADTVPTDADTADITPLTEFPIRIPQEHSISCNGESQLYWDQDFRCRLFIGEETLEIYLQARPTGCTTTFFPWPTFTDGAQGWLQQGDQVVPFAAAYDWGGGHHNDAFHVALPQGIFVLYHASFGFGWRACAPVNCLIQCAADATFASCDAYGGYAVNGCTRESGGPPPAMPIWCAPINADGTVPPLRDPWQGHDGADPLLPCLGDI